MWNEHFGIGVVEMMAAGLLVIAHNSGGPRADIVQQARRDNGDATTTRTGFLASTAKEYAEALHEALSLSKDDAMGIRERARRSANQFSDEMFSKRLRTALLESNVLR
mmetsp:Transcript_18933/g.32439  ORF Transcript_18933/g.32439 Transcript_18933/m.32439 type:complete len:108 (-) Transcript_18933:138-461(-)